MMSFRSPKFDSLLLVQLVQSVQFVLLCFLCASALGEEESCTVGADGTTTCVDSAVSAAATEAIDTENTVQTAYGVPQTVSGVHADATRERIVAIDTYMLENVFSGNDAVLHSVKDDCQLRHELCAFWAAIGECEANPNYMQLTCAPACFSCEKLSFDARCPMTNLTDPIWKSGDLERMFQRIVEPPYEARVLLRPGQPNPSYEDSPWVVLLDNFLTPDECTTLISLGAERGYERSKDVGAKKFDGTYDSNLSSGRTSTNAWCLDECYNHTVTRQVIDKMEALTAIPDSYSEYLQLLKYEEGQFYHTHHDYIHFHINRAQGPRVLTVFLYLNDVEEGGGTNFPHLNLTVEAKQGRALIWPSVLNDDPSKKDGRTEHQALPVIKGIKYGANAWLHLRNFKKTFAENCI